MSSLFHICRSCMQKVLDYNFSSEQVHSSVCNSSTCNISIFCSLCVIHVISQLFVACAEGLDLFFSVSFLFGYMIRRRIAVMQGNIIFHSIQLRVATVGCYDVRDHCNSSAATAGFTVSGGSNF